MAITRRWSHVFRRPHAGCAGSAPLYHIQSGETTRSAPRSQRKPRIAPSLSAPSHPKHADPVALTPLTGCRYLYRANYRTGLSGLLFA